MCGEYGLFMVNTCYEFALYPFQGDWKQADLTKRSLEYAFQTPSVQTIKTSNTMDCELQPLNASLENDVILTALYPNKVEFGPVILNMEN